MNKKIVNTSKAPAPIGPYNQAVKMGNMIFISGQIALVPESGDLKMSTIEEETTQVMENLKSILNSENLGFEHVVKTTILLSDMSLFTKVNEIYGSYFHSDFPARETFAVKGLPKNVNVEISMIAAE